MSLPVTVTPLNEMSPQKRLAVATKLSMFDYWMDQGDHEQCKEVIIDVINSAVEEDVSPETIMNIEQLTEFFVELTDQL